MPSKSSVRLRFKDALQPQFEFQLVHKFGFKLYSKKSGEWIIFAKDVNDKDSAMVPVTQGLTVTTIKDLETKVSRIVNGFVNPDENKDIIKVRCLELAKLLDDKQAAWIKGWVRHVIDEDDPPWNEEGNAI